jgi:hypothetical protein
MKLKYLLIISLVVWCFGCTNSTTSNNWPLTVNTGGGPGVDIHLFGRVKLAAATLPSQKTVAQGPKSWFLNVPSGDNAPHAIQNTRITDGGLVQALGGKSISISNCSNVKGPNSGGMYAGVMLWPPVPAGKVQAAIPKCVIADCYFKQGSAEAAGRSKCDDFTALRCTFEAYIQPNGQPWKQIFEGRHGFMYHFIDCIWKNGWPSMGRQKTADNSPQGWHWETTQNIDQVFFINNTFTRWANPPFNTSVLDRPPGVRVIHFVNCKFPNGKTVTKDQ